MKQILIILGLFASVTTFAQSPRIKLNQITKDTVKGSVLISSPTDSGMVYSRDFYVAYGADTVLILYGDTLAATSGIISSVLSDGVTITGNGTSGNELKVDTSLIATLTALNDSLATVPTKTTPDGVTITGDGSVGNPLKVDTATVISTIQGLVDTLTARGYLTANETITLSGDVTGSGTTAITATVVDDSHNHIISNVDFLQDSLDAKANDSDLNNYLLTSNYIVDSTRINLTGDTAYYYQNGVLIGTGAIAGGGGGGSGTVTDITAGTFLSGGTITTSGTIALDTASAGLKTYISENIGTVDLASEVTGTLPVANGGTGATTLTSGAFLKGNGTSAVSGSSNLTETADTVFIDKYLNVDTSTLYVDATNNSVGIGTSSPQGLLHIGGNTTIDTDYGYKLRFDPNITVSASNALGFSCYPYFTPTQNVTNLFNLINALQLDANGYTLTNVENAFYRNDFYGTSGTITNSLTMSVRAPILGTGAVAPVNQYGIRVYNQGKSGMTNSYGLYIDNQSGATNSYSAIFNGGNVGIGTTSPSETLDVNGNARFRSIGSGASAGALHYTSTGVLTTNTSDARLKTNLQPLENTLNKLLGINTYTFNWIDETDRVDLGMIAQEVEQIFPNLVFTNNVDGYKGIHYDKFSSILTKAIQEQQTIIETQQSEIDQLKTLITDLTNRLIILENK